MFAYKYLNDRAFMFSQFSENKPYLYRNLLPSKLPAYLIHNFHGNRWNSFRDSYHINMTIARLKVLKFSIDKYYIEYYFIKYPFVNTFFY